MRKPTLLAAVFLICLAMLLQPTQAGLVSAEEAIKELIEKKGEDKLISIGYYNTVTGETFYYNKDLLINAASLYKVPLNMYYYELEAAGEISPDERFAGVSLFRCHQLSLQYSDNSTSEAMRRAVGTYAEYKTLTDKYMGVCAEEMDEKYLKRNFLSAYTMLNCLEYLYENSEFFAEEIAYLKAAKTGDFLELKVSEYEIAQKYGYFEGAVNIAGIVYSPTPYLLCILTQNVSSSIRFIGDVNRALLDYTASQSRGAYIPLLSLDTRSEPWFNSAFALFEGECSAARLSLRPNSPDENLRLGTAIKMLCLVYSAISGEALPKTIAQSPNSYCDFLAYAAEHGLIPKLQAQNPEQAVTRAELALLLDRAISAAGFEPSSGSYCDAGVSRAAICGMYRSETISGATMSEKISPLASISYEEAAAVAALIISPNLPAFVGQGR